MKNNFKWHKEQINGKWYSVCDHKVQAPQRERQVSFTR